MKLLNTFPVFLKASFIFLLVSNSALAQKASTYRISFYNLENLFHPDDDSTKSDGDFTPEGSYNWSDYRYKDKCNRMAKAILSIGEWEPPAIVGLAEVENIQALEDLVSTDVLRKVDYKIIHFESPDRRGIDVAMLYRHQYFTPAYTKPVKVSLPDDPDFKTRDILYVKGYFNKSKNDTLHIFVNHWPSRYGGQAISEPKRIQAAKTLKHITDSLFLLKYPANIIIVGDFNDEWENISLSETLQALPTSKPGTDKNLVNLMAEMPQTAGSHRYRGVWSYLDQIIVSNNLLLQSPVLVKTKSAYVVNHSFLLETTERYPGDVPYRTFIGRKYNGGFSDHLPVYIDLILE